VQHLKGRYHVATLSRGYKRKTKGYALANETTTAIEIGDEPMQFYKKFPDVPIAIGEERLVAIPQLLHDRPETQVIILDDAFQHRAVRAGLNIVLTDYGNLFTRDFYLPTGDLRDARSSYKRAEILVVTKCPADLSGEEKASIIQEIDPVKDQDIYFATIAYGNPYHITSHATATIDNNTEVLLVTGIANPKPLKIFLEDHIDTYHMMHYNDHHIFSIDDFRDIKKRFDSIDAEKKMVLTTEKDAMRLLKFSAEIDGMPFYVIPIEHKFLFNEEHLFLKRVTGFVEHFKNPS
jgi:tetraacyldisaccharide 4'-kinase